MTHLLALLLTLALSPGYEQARLDLSLEVAARAWSLDPVGFRSLAWVESNLQVNPKRYSTREPWGDPPLGRRWRICGLLQLAGGQGIQGQPRKVRVPDCGLLVLGPWLPAWYGAAHLAGWRKSCGERRMYECYNAGFRGMGREATFTAKVERWRGKR